MAIYRQVQLSFWSDEKVLDEFTPEDKYFYLYLFTNPQTNLCGCYELSWAQTVSQTGYGKDTIIRLLDRFENVHKVLKYSNETKEVYLTKWHKYNWTTSARFLIPLRQEIEEVKDENHKMTLVSIFNVFLNNAFSKKNITEKEREMLENIEFFDIPNGKNIPYLYGMDTTVTVTVNNNINNITNSFNKNIKDIIDYLNIKTNKKYTYSNKSFNRLIQARLKEGHSVDDFKTVIDKKCDEWLGSDMEQYLKPTTLFAPSHFEEYLNQTVTKKAFKGNANSQGMNIYEQIMNS